MSDAAQLGSVECKYFNYCGHIFATEPGFSHIPTTTVLAENRTVGLLCEGYNPGYNCRLA